MNELTWTLIILLLMVIGFIWNSRFPFALTGFITIVLLAWVGVLPVNTALSFLCDSNVVMIGATFVVAAALLKTDVIFKIVNMIQQFGRSERALVAGFSIIMAILTQITQPPIVLALLCPLIYQTCKECNIAPTRVILPVGFTGIIWVGTVPIAHGAAAWGRYEALLETMGMPGMGIWDLMFPRLPGCILSLLFTCLWGYKLCPMEASGKIELPEHGMQKEALPRWKQNMTYLIFILVTIGMFTSSLTGLNITLIACTGAVAIAFFRIMDEKSIYRSLPMGMMFMIAGTLAAASALTSSGAGEVLGDWLIRILGENSSEFKVTMIFFMLPFIITQFMSNTAVDSLFSPILLVTCQALGINPIPHLASLRVAGACSVLTPMATVTVGVIMLCGGYRLKDVVKFSVPPMLVVAVSSILITLFSI